MSAGAADDQEGQGAQTRVPQPLRLMTSRAPLAVHRQHPGADGIGGCRCGQILATVRSGFVVEFPRQLQNFETVDPTEGLVADLQHAHIDAAAR